MCIRDRYYNKPYEQGGLADTSVWKTDPELAAELQSAFDNLKNDTPVASYVLTYETRQQINEYTAEHGVGNSREPDALQKLYDLYLAPNRVR